MYIPINKPNLNLLKKQVCRVIQLLCGTAW